LAAKGGEKKREKRGEKKMPDSCHQKGGQKVIRTIAEATNTRKKTR